MTHRQFKSASIVSALLFVSTSAWAAPPRAPLPPPGDSARMLQVGGKHEQNWNNENQNQMEPRGGQWHKGK
jgi:hypothetical protein